MTASKHEEELRELMYREADERDYFSMLWLEERMIYVGKSPVDFVKKSINLLSDREGNFIY